MKLCKDCKHYKPYSDNIYSGLDECERPSGGAFSFNPVNGRYNIKFILCGTQREDSWFWSIILGTCGERGRFWEAKDD